MYRPGVMPDTQGLAPGIAGAGNAIAGALGTYAGWKRDDVVRADQQAHAERLQQGRFDLESALIDKRMERDMTMFGMERNAQQQDKDAEKAMADEMTRYANAGMMAFLEQIGASPDLMAAGQGLPEKAREPFLKAAVATKLKEHERQQEIDAEIRKAMEIEAQKPAPNPQMLTIRKPDGSPSEYGVPYDGKRVLGGAMPMDGPRPPLSSARPYPLRYIEQDAGSLSPKVPKVFDPNTGKVIDVEKPVGASIAPAPVDTVKTITDYLNQLRQPKQ